MARRRRLTYKPNHRSFGEFMVSEQMRDVTADVAADIAAMASMMTPSSKPGAQEHTGLHRRVKSGFRVVRAAGTVTISGNPRVLVQVVNEADGAALVEFGARGVPRQRMLGTAGSYFGDYHDWGGDG